APSAAMINEKMTMLADVTVRGKKISLPVWIVPGHADDCATIFYGYGRERGGRVATIVDANTVDAPNTPGPVGFNTYVIRFSDGLSIAAGAQIAPTHRDYAVACT